VCYGDIGYHWGIHLGIYRVGSDKGFQHSLEVGGEICEKEQDLINNNYILSSNLTFTA
jgi:hypothetical protein